MIVIEDLDPTSQAFARELLRGDRRLQRHARAEPRPGGGSFLVLSIPSESERGGHLVIDAGEGDRVRVEWGRFSMEFDTPPEGGRTSQLPDAISLVEDILADDVVLYIHERDGRYRGCGKLHSEVDEVRLIATLKPGDRVEVFSWLGEHDHVLCPVDGKTLVPPPRPKRPAAKGRSRS